MRQTYRTGLALAALALIALPATKTCAADYPDRPVRVVVPFAAAGVTDVVARVVFDRIGQVTGKTFVIDNRPGAGGTIAVGQVASSDPDGYTLVMSDPSGSLPANITLYPDLKYDPRKDLAPVAIFGNTGAMLVVSNGFPAKTLQELVALGRSKPSELTYASTGIGTPGHLNGALFCKLAGIAAVHVPYRVVGQAVTDLIAGRTSFWISPIPTNLQQVQQGQLRVLAVAGNERSPDLPDVPTMRETGIGDFDASTTYAVFAPVGTPNDNLNWLRGQIKSALDDAGVQQKLHAAGVQPKYGTPDEIAQLLAAQTPQWADVIKSAGIKIN
jgi:tripartite-type tricarboxylate transporter receptor subunit TctC